MMDKMKMRPADIKECCESETTNNKIKIACLSLLMGAIATSQQAYFDGLVWRSGMFQQHALAGKVDRIDFYDKLDPNAMLGLTDGFYYPSDVWSNSKLYSQMTDEEQQRRKYENWMKMHNDNVIWFDTSACIDAPHIGDVNRANGSDNVDKVGTWRASYQTVAITNNYNWADPDMYRDLQRDFYEMIEECDVDCQAKGSQLTIIAILMGTLYGLVWINALCMFIGTWRYRARICSFYFSGVVCMFHVAVLIAVGVLMFTRYNGICSRSMRTTSAWDGAYIWTMADDFYATFSMWIGSFFLLFGFMACAHQQFVREKMM